MQMSYSRVECFESCPFKFKLRYLDGLTALPNDDPANALLLGTAMHTGLEKGVDAAIDQYLMSYPIVTDEHFDEVMKLEHLIPLAAKMLPNGEFEKLISNSDFTGFIDFLTTDNGVDYDLYDFKYSNNADNYRKSGQLHVYKYFFELVNPDKRINRMFFLMIPKTKIKRGKKEDLNRFRARVQDELNKLEPWLMPIEYDPNKVIGWFTGVKHALETVEHEQRRSYFCNWCEYQDYCEKGIDFMLLPKNERRNIEKVTKRVLWLYGAPFSGKTTFANKFDDPLMLNTDGNIKFVDAPYIPIRNEVKVEGRITKTTLAWEVFKGAVEELEKKSNDFKTIIVDLLEDLYEHCRVYMYREMGITHESDDSFRAWDKVRVEFLSTLKRLMNLDYENIILISHEDTSKDITRKGGDKITAIKPNLQEKTSNKVAGMVDIVARVVADGDTRTLSFKSNEVVFGGGRLTASTKEIPLDYAKFLGVYDEANKNAAQDLSKGRKKAEPPKQETAKADPPPEPKDEPAPPVDDLVEKVKDHFVQVGEQAIEHAKALETPASDETVNADDDKPPFDTDEPADSGETAQRKEAENKPAVRTRKRRGDN